MNLNLKHSHDWNLAPAEAIGLQEQLRRYVVCEPLAQGISRVAGVDVGFHEGLGRAAVAVLDYPSMQAVELVTAEAEVTFPYVPGLLSFREVPVVLAAFEKLKELPQVLIVDGQGIAHPRRFGIATHLGVLLDLPSVGCAKSLLVGRYGTLGDLPGDRADLMDKGELIGAALRSRKNCKPLIISCGQRCNLESAVQLILSCCRGYRLPEPTRQAHNLASN